MSISAAYRLGIWLPLLVPASVAVLVHGMGWPLEWFPDSVKFYLLASLLYGGVPYSVLALWATWWVGGRPECEVRRLMLRAPLLMVAVFVPMALIAGVAVGAPRPFIAVAILGAIVIIPLGYAYVGVVALLRLGLGPRAA